MRFSLNIRLGFRTRDFKHDKERKLTVLGVFFSKFADVGYPVSRLKQVYTRENVSDWVSKLMSQISVHVVTNVPRLPIFRHKPLERVKKIPFGGSKIKLGSLRPSGITK